MMISRFNRYFAKHGRITYILLGIIISFIFVIFVTPGDVFSNRSNGPSSFGTMYGKKLKKQKITKSMSETYIALCIKYPQILKRQLDNDILLSETLRRMRALHEAEKLNITDVREEEIAEAIHQAPLFKEKDSFSLKAMQSFIENYLRPHNLTARDLDRLTKENIIIDRLEKHATKDCKANPLEVRSYIEQYKIQYAEYPIDIEKDSEISSKDITEYFQKRSAEVAMPDTKSAIVASFLVRDVQAKLDAKDCPKQLKKELEPTEEDLKKQYKNGAKSIYKAKTFVQAKPAIYSTLLNRNIRRYLNIKAASLSSKFAAVKKGKAKAAQENEFRAAAVKARAEIKETPKFHRIEDMNFAQHGKNLAQTILGMDTVGEVSGPIAEASGISVAFLKLANKTPVPKKIDSEVRTIINEQLTDERAMIFYKENLTPYIKIAPNTKTYTDLAQNKIQELQNDINMNDSEKQIAYAEYRNYLEQHIFPFYTPEQRSLVLVSFAPEKYTKGIKVTPEELQAAYKKNAKEYLKQEVKLAKIELQIKGLDKKAVDAKKAALADVLEKMTKGESFEKLATKISENKKIIDTEYVNVTTLHKMVREAAAKLKKGEVSGIINTGNTLYMIKMLENRNGRTLEMVKEELTKQIIEEKSILLANEAAAGFADKTSDAWWSNSKKQSPEAPEKIFKDIANKDPKTHIDDIQNINSYSYFTPSIGRDQALSEAVFSLKSDAPVSTAIKGSKGSYVALLLNSTAPFIQDPTKDTNTKRTLNRVYRRSVAMEKVQEKVEADSARILQALKTDKDLNKAAAPVKFKSIPEFGRMASGKLSKETGIISADVTLSALNKTDIHHFIPAQETRQGYVLIYLEGKTIPDNEQTKSMQEYFENNLKSRAEQKAIMQLYQRLEIESNTQLIDGLLKK